MRAQEKKFDRWYQTNRDEHNRKRREQYAKDPARREKARRQAREYRERTREPREKAGFVRVQVGPDRSVLCWRIGKVADYLGRYTKTLRVWESAGLIPAPTVRFDHRRVYTEEQVSLIAALSRFLKKNRYVTHKSNYQKKLDRIVQKIQEEW